MGDLPSGTLTFLFTDLEGSTALWEAEPDVMREAVARHDELLADAVTANNGQVVKTTGDGMVAVFVNATDGVAAALACQQALGSEDWTVPISARMGLYTGEAEAVDGDYHAPVLNRAARLMDAGHGGQVLVSGRTAALVEGRLPASADLLRLGEHRLKDLDRPEAVFQLLHPELERTFPALRGLDQFAGNLPTQVSSFLGRERELGRCRDALAEHRVVTLTGVGGVGKTRLAVQVADSLLGEFRDGAWLVELAPVRDPEAVALAAAGVFNVSGGSDIRETLLEVLAGKQLVLILDNCEHLLGPVAELADAIVHRCPDISALATSREPLGIDGEFVMGVPSLPAEVAQALFAQRATAASPELVVDETDEGVARVCERLDGVPLAIELAAVRVRSLPPSQLAERLEDRFAVLAGGRRGAVERHQTLRAAIDWSYELLTPPEQRLLARLAVFAGGWTLEAAEEICAGDPIDRSEVLELHDSLVTRSLVTVEPAAGEVRFALLETIRQYAEEKLAELGETRALGESHAAWCANIADGLQEHVWHAELAGWARRVEAESDNLTAAASWAIQQGDTDVALRIAALGSRAAAQPGVWSRTPTVDFESVLAMPGAEDHPLYPVALYWFATEKLAAGLVEEGESLLDASREAEARLGQPNGGRVEVGLPIGFGMARQAVGDWEGMAALARESADLALSGGSKGLAAYHFSSAAMANTLGGHGAEEAAQAERAYALARDSGSVAAMLNSLVAMAYTHAETDPDTARWSLHEALTTRDRLGFSTAIYGTQLAVAAAITEDWNLFLQIARDAVQEIHWSANKAFLIGVFNLIARGIAEQYAEPAAVLLGASAGVARRLPITQTAGAPTGAGMPILIDARREAKDVIAANLTETETTEAQARGEAMSQAEAVAYARTAIATALETFAQDTPDSPRPDTGEEADLTARQLEVAQLVARGLSNKDIAKRLDISAYTVETHVRNILERLDATNRTQIVAWMMSQGE